MRESKIEGYLREEVAKLGGWMEKHTSPGTRGPPDNIVMWPIYMVVDRWWDPFGPTPHIEFIETKSENGVLEVLQERDHERRRKLGFLVHVIWNREQADAYLRTRGKE